MDKIRAKVAQVKYDAFNLGLSVMGFDDPQSVTLTSPRGIEYQGSHAGFWAFIVGFEAGLKDGSIMPHEEMVWKPMTK